MSKNGSLVVTRSEGDGITITTSFGEEITIKLEKLGNTQCKVRIDAPKDVSIVRSELIEHIVITEPREPVKLP